MVNSIKEQWLCLFSRLRDCLREEQGQLFWLRTSAVEHGEVICWRHVSLNLLEVVDAHSVLKYSSNCGVWAVGLRCIAVHIRVSVLILCGSFYIFSHSPALFLFALVREAFEYKPLKVFIIHRILFCGVYTTLLCANHSRCDSVY